MSFLFTVLVNAAVETLYEILKISLNLVATENQTKLKEVCQLTNI